MARPFDERSYPAMSSLASQTTLGYDDDGHSTSRLGKKDKKRIRLPKIQSSPNDGSLATARSNHDRSKRGTPTSPTFVPDYLLQATGSSLPSAHGLPSSAEKSSSRSKAKIKPLLRKFSSQEVNGIDLSRSAAENESFSIYEQSAPTRTLSGSARQGGYHNRTTSGASAISTATSSSNYVHPMRQTPLPYTPPLAASYKNSLESTDPSENPTPYAPLPGSTRPTPYPPLHIRTGSSFTNPSSSQSALPGTPSSLRYPTNTNGSDMVSPSLATGRSSLESALRKRSRSNTTHSIDPVQQAASVQHLRQKFQEKEARKDKKYAEQEKRKEEKRERKEERKAGKRSRVGSGAASEKSSIVGVALPPGSAATQQGWQSREALGAQSSERLGAYGSHTSQPGGRVFEETPTLRANERGKSEKDTSGGAGKKVQSQWTLLWMRVRTIWLKLRRKMSGNKKTKKKKKKKGHEA